MTDRIDELRERLEAQPASRLFAQLVEELRRDGQLDEAIRVCREGLKQYPNYSSAHVTLGHALLDKGDLAEAREELEFVVTAAPDNILAGRLLGECLEGLGEHSAARAHYETMLLLVPDDSQLATRLEALKDPDQPKHPAPAAVAPEPPDSATPGTIPSEQHGTSAPDDAGADPEAPAPAQQSAASDTTPASESATPDSAPDAPEETPAPPPPLPSDESVPADTAAEPPTTDAEGEIATTVLAELYLKQGHPQKAAEVYRAILERDPDDEEAKDRLAGLERESTVKAERRQKLQAALARLERFLEAVRRTRRA